MNAAPKTPDPDAVALFLDATPDAVVQYDRELRYRWINPAAAQVLGLDRSAVVGKGNTELFGADAAAEIEPHVQRAFDSGHTQAARHTLPATDGLRHFDARYVPLKSLSGDIRAVVGLCRDITDNIAQRALQDRALRESESRFRAVFERSPLGMAIVSADGKPQDVNPVLEDVLGRPRSALQALRFDQFTHPDDVSADMELFSELLSGEREHYQLEKRYLKPDGQIVWGRLSVSMLPARDDEAPLFLALVEDVTERQRLEEELNFQATHDPLTGLYNRLRGEQILENEYQRAERYGSRLTVIMADVDRFKRVNDNFGHETGDKVLQELAGVFTKRVRSVDAVCRWGGEEFLVILPETDAEPGRGVAEDLRRDAAGVQLPDGSALTISLGVAALGSQERPKKCIMRADAALYQAKTGGRDRTVVAGD